MTVDRTVNLTLAEEGWVTLDSATISVYGDVKRIIDEMQRIVDDEVVLSLCERLGICSTGFLFHDTLKNITRFYRENKASPTYRTHYLWNDASLHEDWSNCLQWLFVKVRESQYSARRDGNIRAEDYFVNLPVSQHDSRVFEPERSWRQQFGVHYCSVGEMLYSATLWRLLSLARDSGLGRVAVTELNMPLDHCGNDKAPCTWRGKPVIPTRRYGLARETEEAITLFQELWSSEIGPQQRWYDEWPTLLLSLPDHSPNVPLRSAVLAFIERANLMPSVSGIDIANDTALNQALIAAAPRFVEWLSYEDEVKTVDDALLVLETLARLPILPFYFWNALNAAPTCYCVIPIWTSQNHWVTVPDGKCYHLGLALTGIRPLQAWDWTFDASDVEQCSMAEPLVLINVLRLMARPLVENNLYECLWTELKQVIADAAADAGENTLGLGSA